MKKATKRILGLGVLVAIAMTFSGCLLMMFLQVGYWQALFESLGSYTVVQTIEDYDTPYTWKPITAGDAAILWETPSYRNMRENPPVKVTAYWQIEDEIRKYKDITVSKFENNKYSKSISKWIYSLEDMVALNYYVPSSLPEGAQIYVAKDHPELVKFVSTDPQYNSGNVEITTIYKNGFLVEQILKNDTYVVEY